MSNTRLIILRDPVHILIAFHANPWDRLLLGSSADLEAADWSLTPGRYVGVAPAEVDEDFDFEQTLRDIHTELADLTHEAIDLSSKIQKNFEEMGIGSSSDNCTMNGSVTSAPSSLDLHGKHLWQ